jgi:threonine/homoserine/homoserine lactone efflux protein
VPQAGGPAPTLPMRAARANHGRPVIVSLLGASAALAVLTVVPGPDMAVVTRVALTAGWPAASRTVFGVVAGLLIWGASTVVGLAAVLAASVTVYAVVKVVGGTYLIWLGLGALRRARRLPPEPTGTTAFAGGPWRTGLATNLLNPKIAVFYTGLLPQLVPSGAPTTITLAGLVGVHAALTFVWLNLYALLLRRARRPLQRPSIRRTLEGVTGCVLVGFGLRVVIETRP